MSDRLNPLEDLGDLFVNRDKELEKFSPKGRRSALEMGHRSAASWSQ